MSLQKKLSILFTIITVAALGLLSQNLLVEYLHAGIYLIGIISALSFLKMKDGMFKMYIILHFLLLGIASYCIGSKDIWTNWFGPFVALTFVGFVPFLLASMRRNYHSHALSLMRQKPWISAVLMGLGYLIYTYAGDISNARQLPIILLVAIMMITSILVFERFQKVNRKSFNYMIISCFSAILLNSIWINSMTNYDNSIHVYLSIVLVSVSCLFLISSADRYEIEASAS